MLEIPIFYIKYKYLKVFHKCLNTYINIQTSFCPM